MNEYVWMSVCVLPAHGYKCLSPEMEREATVLLAKLLADAARDHEAVPRLAGEQHEESPSHGES